ncbi:MAG TPA: PD-(D/E)XK nuclease-like domain-containing protein [Phycisphaerae bacterium]|nr:PD-(D/E)XK nuclease-like domain-containing protein [Phycisphaerae bacterium]
MEAPPKESQEVDLGIFEGVSYEQYDEWSGLRKSRLWTIVQSSPRKFKWEIEHPRPTTPSLDLGRACHCSVFEPDKFDVLYVPTPPPPAGAEKWDRRTKVHKEAWAEFLCENAGKEILEPGEYEKCLLMRENVRQHPQVAPYLEAAKFEVSMRWRDVGTSLLLKGRMDAWIPQTGLFMDLKTCRFPTQRAAENASYRFGYHFQAALYQDGLRTIADKVDTPRFIFVESEPPFDLITYIFAPEFLELARSQYEHALGAVKACAAANVWPGYSEELQQLELPPYAGYEIVPDAVLPDSGPDDQDEESMADFGVI